jgi:hypothetical protein
MRVMPNERVLRGGSWNNNGHNLRSANRNRNAPATRNNNNGFRLVLRPNTLLYPNWQKGFCRERLESIRHYPAMFAKTSENQIKSVCSVASAKNNPIFLCLKTRRNFPSFKKLTTSFYGLCQSSTVCREIINSHLAIESRINFAKYEKDKLGRLEKINGKLDILRYQIKLLLDFKLIEGKKFYYASELLNEIGVELGSWIKQKQI